MKLRAKVKYLIGYDYSAAWELSPLRFTTLRDVRAASPSYLPGEVPPHVLVGRYRLLIRSRRVRATTDCFGVRSAGYA